MRLERFQWVLLGAVLSVACGCSDDSSAPWVPSKDAAPDSLTSDAAVGPDASDSSAEADAFSVDVSEGGEPNDTSSPDVAEEPDTNCVSTDGGVELCDGVDNDCNGKIDETFDLTQDPSNCGVCSLFDPKADCNLKVENAKQVTCTATAGTVGTCDYTQCDQNYFDVDSDRTNGCEYYCFGKGSTDTTCDNVDDDCNGLVDDGVDKCKSPTDCGKCGRNCNGHAHAVGKCVTSDPPPATCDDTNTHCELASCASGWIDANGLFTDGCEYQCTRTKRTNPSDPATIQPCDLSDPACGIEYCDGLDNDCNGKIDDATPPC